MRALDALALARDTERIVNSVARKGRQEEKGRKGGSRATRRWRANRDGARGGNGKGGSLVDSAVGGLGERNEEERRRGMEYGDRIKEKKKKQDTHRTARPPALGRACIRPRNLDCRHTSTSAALLYHETYPHGEMRARYHLSDVLRCIHIYTVSVPSKRGPDATCTIGAPGAYRGPETPHRKVDRVIESMGYM